VCATWLASKPKTWKVADFGCGDAQCVPCAHDSVMNDEQTLPFEDLNHKSSHAKEAGEGGEHFGLE
jgi:hypothetical protein